MAFQSQESQRRQLDGQKQTTIALPIIGATAEAVAINFAKGVTAAANAELAKYGTGVVTAANPASVVTSAPAKLG